MNFFKDYLENLGILKDFVKVAQKDDDYKKDQWWSRVGLGNDVAIHNILYYPTVRHSAGIDWKKVFCNYQYTRVDYSELLDIMGSNRKKPSIFKNKKEIHESVNG